MTPARPQPTPAQQAYNHAVQNYLRATSPRQRDARGLVMQRALLATLEGRSSR